jgi:hypothetical protein
VERPVVLEFGSGRTAVAIGVERADDVAAALSALRLVAPRPALVVVGGAAGLDDGELAGLAPLADGLVRAAAGAGAAIVDGGTDAGVMRVVGRAHAEAGAGVPLVGVVVRALAGLPGEPVVPPMAALEPRHTHFVLVPGSSWGEEAPWIARIAGSVAGDHPSVAVLVNGGEIAWTDVAQSLAAGRRVLAVAGTGGTADALAAAAAGKPADQRAAALVRTGLVEAVAPGDDPLPSVQERVEDILGRAGLARGR